ncbi:MAG: hypothetical protein R2909_04245 [Gemmatimonadales bacterium]
MRIRAWMIVLAAALACDGDVTDPSPSPPPPPPPPPAPIEPVAARFPIDGDVNLDRLDGITTRSLELRSALGAGAVVRSVTLRFATANDDRHLYVAAEWPDDTRNNQFDPTLGPVDVDGIVVHFDDDGDGVQEQDEDGKGLFAAFDGAQYIDQRTTAGDATDPIGDGIGRLRYDQAGRLYRMEMLIPIADDANGHDGAKGAATRINFAIFDHLRLGDLTGNVGTAYGSVGVGSATTAWPALAWSTAAVTGHPEIPTGLGGLIAFIADHEGGPEVYTFDPATRTVRRVTNLPGLYKDGVSLSHDRSRVAFHGAPGPTAFTEYEIYVVNVDGSGFAQLTDNQILDGHPGWSPDDTEIVYASFRDAGRAHLVRMTTSGQELTDLTPAGVDDNDPDFLPDGRIVFKTDRFSAVPEVRIAVMDPDGSNVRQLSAVAGTSDHDPVSDGTVTIFERFTKPTNYATDPEAGFSAWDLIEAKVDGSGERTLRADGWVNWLPVFDPSGQFIAHLRGVGYTDVQLMTRDGQPLGRLVPGISRVRYLDWK